LLWLLAAKKKKHLLLHQHQPLKLQQHQQPLQHQLLKLLQPQLLLLTQLSQLMLLLQHRQLTQLSQLTHLLSNLRITCTAKKPTFGRLFLRLHFPSSAFFPIFILALSGIALTANARPAA
jgi:hypothetical protein